jgi:hypothetical protein
MERDLFEDLSTGLKEIVCEGVDWIQLPQDRVTWRVL